MSVRWREGEAGTFEIVERQGLAAYVFGGALMFLGGKFLYWFGTIVVETVREPTWQYTLTAIPWLLGTLAMAALFIVPGALVALVVTRTSCSKRDGVLRQGTFFLVVPRRAREVRLADTRQVMASWKSNRRLSPTKVSRQANRVEIVLANGERLEVGTWQQWKPAVALGRQLAKFLCVEFVEDR